MPRGIRKDANGLREMLEKGVLLIGGEDLDRIDIEDNDPVSVAIMVNVNGYGPHVGAICATQGGHIDSALQTAEEILEEWEMDHNPDYFAELEQEYGDEAGEIFRETFDGMMWEMPASDFASAIAGTKAAEYFDIEESEDEEDDEDD